MPGSKPATRSASGTTSSTWNRLPRMGSWLRAGAAMLAVALVGTAVARAEALSLQSVGAYSEPVHVTSDPRDPDRLFIVERGGRIRLTTPNHTSTFTDLTPLVDSDDGERGLLSMALAPDFASSGSLYVLYTGRSAGAIHVAELTAVGNGADPATLRNVLTIPHGDHPNHNGGQLQFGPDGYLYIGTGDGGGSGDPLENAQDAGILLGKILRIDPRRSGALPYSVPADNPFVGTAGRPEFWSLGLRNPFRFSFDRATGALAIGDVGQGGWEEVDFAPAPAAGRGLNFGWDCREGRHAYETRGCPGGGLTDPVLEYAHGGGRCAVTGGYVVRDPGLEELAGRYVFSDYCDGVIRSAVLGLPVATDPRSEGVDAGSPSSFGEDSCGRIYVASLTGEVSRLVDSTPTRCGAPVPLERCSQSVRGSRRDDVLSGGPGPQSIRGHGGDDRLRGGGGGDCAIGNLGDDRLDGGADGDVLRGGRGRDVVRSLDGEVDTVSCGRDRDRARVDRFDRLAACEKVRVGS
ncbi:MAG: glucose dehydrogenase [Acidobacteria bacterium]|nr:MAG: glucose dehydrogenase [Acidobacteriota bacterium]